MNGSELYQYILDNTLHELRGTWEVTQDNELKVTGSNVNGSYVVFPDALTNFSIEWDMTILSSGSYVNSGISPIILSSYQGSNLEGWNNGSTVTNAELLYYICNYRGTTNFGSLLTFINGTSQGNWIDSGYQDTFVVGTKYRYKLERKNGLFKLYQDNTLISSFTDLTDGMPIYIGWYMWYGGTSWGYQANFIIDNYVVTDLSSEISKYVNGTGLSEVWTNTKNYIASQLLGKSNIGHTHSMSDITDLTVDSALSSSSENPVQNKVVKSALDSKLDVTDVFATWNYANGNLEIPNVFSNTVDSSLSNSSENPVQNKVINAALAGYVPRSGGAVMTGNFLGISSTATEKNLMIGGGDEQKHGGDILLMGTASSPPYAGAICIMPQVGDGQEKYMWIFSDGTWTWNGAACQLVSDQRYKQQITEIDDKLLDAWKDVAPVQFKYNDAVNEKGDNARLHTGYVVQQIDEACKSHNVDISAYGLYCHEEYPERTEEVEVQQEDGTIKKETKVIEEAKEHYSLRYTECLVVECAYLRKKNKELQEQLDKVIARLDKLEKKGMISNDKIE